MRTPSEAAAMARAVVYGSLSKFLLPPDAHTVSAIRSGTLGEELLAALRELPGAPEGRAGRIAWLARSTDDPEARWFRTFDHALVASCPPFETEYAGSEPFLRTADLADVGGFYAAWGQRTGGVKERADHIGVETEFMSLLCQKEAVARATGGPVETCTKAEDRFLVEHLGGFAPLYAERFARVARDDLYVEAVALLAEVVGWDLEHRGLAAEPRHRSLPVVLEPSGGVT